MSDSTKRQGAVADLIGAVSYALLRSFQAAARGTALAPSVALAERQGSFAAEELERYRGLVARLRALTDEPEAALQTLRGPLDMFYEATTAADWLEIQAFHFVGNTITTDFADILAPCVDPETAEAVRRALTGRTEQEAFALGVIVDGMRASEDAKEGIARYVSALVGRALNTMRDALLSSDALEVVLGPGGVKEVVLELLGRHRERLERLGLDTPD